MTACRGGTPSPADEKGLFAPWGLVFHYKTLSLKEKRPNMWELYDALLAGLPRGGTISRAISGERWTLVENDLGGSGYAMTTEGDTVPAHFPNGIEGMRIKVAAGAAKSWNLMEAGLGIAAINSFYNTPERMAELGCAAPDDHYCTRGLDVAGRTVGLIGPLRMPPGPRENSSWTRRISSSSRSHPPYWLGR